MRTHSFFMKLFISFVCLIVIPVSVVYGISVHRLASNSEQEIGHNCIRNLQTADKGIGQLEDSLRKDSLNLSRGNAIASMSVYGSRFDLTDSDEMLDICQVLDTMVKTAQTDDNYYSVYLYLENFPYIFTTDRDMVPSGKMSDTEWMQYYKKYKEQKVPVSFTMTHPLNMNSIGETTNPIYLISYIYPLTPYTTSLQGAIVVNVKENSISKMVNNETSTADGSILIIDSAGNVISAADNGILCKNVSKKAYISPILKSKAVSGYYPYQIDSTDCLISYYKSSANGWIYVGIAPVSSLMNNQRAINKDMVLVSMLIIILGVFIAYMVSRKIYSPVKTMVRTIKSNKMANLVENDDEFSIIFKVLNKALNTINKSDAKYKEIEAKQIRENAVIKLIGDDLLEDESKNALSEYLTRGWFICVVVSIDKYDKAMANDEEKQWGYLKTLLIGLAEKTLGENVRCIGCAVKKGEIILVCNFESKQPDDCYDCLKESFGGLQTEVAKMMDNSITVGIGKYYADITDIRESYIQAEAAMKQKLKFGLGRIIIWNDEWNQNVYYYPFEMEEKIRNFLELGIKPELTAKVRKLAEDLKERSKLSCENIVQIATQLMGNTIIKYMIDHHINSADVYGVNFNIYSEFAHMETLDEIRDMLIEKYSMLIDFSLQVRNQNKNVDSIMEYIHSNYKKDIGISDISEYVGLSYSHVRKIFKDEIGMNIVDYINSMRIREAKVLLMGKELSVRNIATSLGYNNDQSFERYFKKLVGITPGEFRSRMLSDRKSNT